MRTKKHYEDLLDRNPNASVGFTLAADMVYAARHGSIDTPNVHGDEEWKNIARNLKSRYGENLTGDQVRHEIALISCLRCGATWTPRKQKPIQCPRCKSPFWDKPRKGDK